MVVKEAIAHADNGFSISGRIPRKTEAWGNIVVIAWNAFHNPQGLFRCGVDGGGRREQRCNFHVVTHAVIQSQLAIHAPGILREEAERKVVERLIRVSDALDVGGRNTQAIGLQSGCAGQTCESAAEAGCGDSPKIDVAAKIQFENLRLCRTQLDQVDVGAKLESVVSPDFRDGIREFRSALNAVHGRVRLTAEIGYAGNIDSNLI